nr:11975_t:CDS:2 [Entrophospora candida]
MEYNSSPTSLLATLASKKNDPFNKLSDEIWLKIFIELSVSKNWYRLSLDDMIWQHHSRLLFLPDSLPPRTRSTKNSWERFYRLQINWLKGSATKVMSFRAHNNSITTLKLRGDILITGSNNHICVWDMRTGKRKRTIDVGVAINCVDFSEQKDIIVCGPCFGEFGYKIFSLSNGELLGKFTDNHNQVGTQCISMNEELIALGTHKGIIHVLSLADERKIAQFEVFNDRQIAGIQLVGNNMVISVSSINGIIEVFNVKTHECIHKSTILKTSISSCTIDYYSGAKCDILCIAPQGSVFHLRWDFNMTSSTTNLMENEDGDEEEKLREIFSKEPKILYKNEDFLHKILCVGIDSKYNHGIIGSLLSYPAKSKLLIYNPNKGPYDMDNSIIKSLTPSPSPSLSPSLSSNNSSYSSNFLLSSPDTSPSVVTSTSLENIINTVFVALSIDEERIRWL